MILKQEKKVGGPKLSDFKTYCQGTVIRYMWDLHTDSTQVDGRRQSLEINPHICGRLIFEKSAKGQGQSFQNGTGKIGYPYAK